MLRHSLLFAPALLLGMAVGLLSGAFGKAPAHTNIPKDLASYNPVVKEVLPAVVSIESRSKPAQRMNQQDMQRVPEEFRKFFGNHGGLDETPFQTPNERPSISFGSGFLVDPKGTILTNNHVVAGASEVEVQLADGRKFVSKDIVTDPRTDLAIVRIQAKDALPYLELGDSSAMQIGDRVLAVGAPFGLTGSVTSGIISARGRNVHLNMYEDFLQTDAAINPGNSGGPLVNLEGKVIGINTAIKSQSGGSEGVGLAISSDMAKKIMAQLLKDGRVHRGYLGVQIKDLSEEVGARLGLGHQPGVLVAKVEANSPGAKAGLKDGDVITALDGKEVLNRADLQRRVVELTLGKPVPMTVWRDGKSQTLQVTIEEMPGAYGLANQPETENNKPQEQTHLDKLGLGVADLTAERAKQLGYQGKLAGALLTEVAPGSLAAQASLERGMLIVKADQKNVANAAALREAVEQADLKKGILLQVQTPERGTDYILLKEPANQ